MRIIELSSDNMGLNRVTKELHITNNGAIRIVYNSHNFTNNKYKKDITSIEKLSDQELKAIFK